MYTYTADKALKACFACFKKCKKLGRVTPTVGVQLFDSFVTPILEYACEVWTDGSYKEVLERIQLRYLKMLIGVNSNTCNQAVYAETGRYPIYIRHTGRIVKYYCRLTRLSEHKIVKQVFLRLKHMADLGYNTWAFKVKQIFVSHNLVDAFNQDYVTLQDEGKIVKQIVGNLKCNFEKKCLSQLHQFSSLGVLANVKVAFSMSLYLVKVRDFKLRKAIAKLRLSNHALPIQKGRYTKPITARENRLCRLCNYEVIGDEFHFIFICPYFDQKYFN